MLLSLRIENFALIDQLELEFGRGLNVLTGETGAGKSIILDALDVALGGKVNSRLIRTGTERALVEATFRVDSGVRQWLHEQEIDLFDDATVVCSREVATLQSSLRTRSRINGILVNRQMMEKLRDRLIEITAQGQTVQLTAPILQRELLDLYGGSSLLKQRQKVASAYTISIQAWQALEHYRQFEKQRLQRLDILEYQAKELDAANLRDADELEQLEQERQRLSHVVELQQLSYQVYQVLYQHDAGEAAATDLLGKAEAILTDMVSYDIKLQAILEMVSAAQAQVVEAGRQMNAYGEELEAEPNRLSEVEERIRELKLICRKYGPTLTEAIAHYQQIETELKELLGSSQSLEELEKKYQIDRENLTQACNKLTELRQEAALDLEKRLINELKPLAMEKVKFEVAISPIPATVMGADKVVFYFSSNPGEPLQPLAATASGGEMSRFLLALKACFEQVDTARTLIFDEIDVGVSGRVAQAIAEKLHQLSQRHQVLCVTHQPLVAAMADNHFRVDKQVIDVPLGYQNQESKVDAAEAAIVDLTQHAATSQETTIPNTQTLLPEVRTVVRVNKLDNHSTRREELAQLAGGQSAQEAIAFADSLLTQAANKRQQKKE